MDDQNTDWPRLTEIKIDTDTSSDLTADPTASRPLLIVQTDRTLHVKEFFVHKPFIRS